MARITVEDSLKQIPNRFELTLIATYRARMLAQGHTPQVESRNKPTVTALREVAEETGIVLAESSLHDWRRSVAYEIYAHWRHRYADGVTHNTEHWFSARIDRSTPIRLSEHTAYAWQPALSAAEQVFSPSNREIIEEWHRTQAQR